MFRPPVSFFIKMQTKRYEELHQDFVPEWVFTIDRPEMLRLLETFNRVKLKFHPKILVMGELYSGSHSVWSDQKNHWDSVSKPAKKSKLEN
jgi:hypothetical protein